MLVVDLIQNVALLLALTVGYDLVSTSLPTDSRRGAALQGVLFGTIAVIGMTIPMTFVPGVVYDGRSIVLAVAGYVGGPVVAAVAAVIASAYRAYLGGIGALPGILVILESAALGIVVFYLRRRDPRWERPLWIWLFGVAVHVLMLAAQLLLPRDLGPTVVNRFGLLVLALYPIALVVVLRIFIGHRRQRDMLRELQEREGQYRALFENRHAPMIVFDPENEQIIDVNRAAVEFYGWSRRELRAMNVSDLNTLSAGEIQQEVERAHRADENHYEFRHRLRDGSIRDVAVFSGAVEINGVPRTYSIIEDITERKARDRELYLATYAMEHSAVAIYRVEEPTGKIRYANAQACRVLGYTEHELRAMTVYDIDPTFTEPHWQEHRRRVQETGARTIETMHRRKDGTEFPVEITVSAFRYQDELFTLTFAHDISERKRSEAEIQASLQEKQVLLQEIHHRVRNNLAVLSGLINLQIAGVPPMDASFPAIEKTRDRIMVMAMIHDMLYQAQDFSHVNFSAFVRQLTAHLQAEYPRPHTTLTVDVADIHVDVTTAVPLGLIVSEAITNALKHAHPAGESGTVTVAAHPRDSGVHLSIADDGVGLQNDLERSDSLGFQLMYSLVGQVGGRLRIESGETGGCRVSVDTAVE
ncbi:MAG: PAS domain S-box protein [Alkalispirochaeta sp.]